MRASLKFERERFDKCPSSMSRKEKLPKTWIDLKKGPDPRRGRRYLVKVRAEFGKGETVIVSGRYSGACHWSLDLKVKFGIITHYMVIPR